MKPFRNRLAISTIVLGSSLCLPLSAATFTWDTVVDGASVTGGAGTWDAGVTGTPNWSQDAGLTNVTWPDTGTDNDAVFSGTAGTVTIASGGVVANDLSFTTANYVVSGNSLTLNGATNVINAAAAATISSSLTGTTGFTKSGAALLLLNGDNSGLSGTVTLPNITGTNSAGLSLSGANSIGGITQIDINGTSGADGQFLALANVTLGSGVTLNLSGQGGNSAPVGTLRAVNAPAVVNGPVNLLTGNVRISSSGGGSEMRVNGKISDGVNSFPVSFRFGEGNGVYLTNTANDWGGDAILSAGILRAEPGAVPATTKISIGASGNAWFQTNGTLSRPLGTTSGTGAIDLSNSTAGRIIGLGAKGGALSVNLGGTSSDIVWGTTTGFNPSILGLNNSTADSALTLVNPLDFNGANRVIQVDANTASLTGGIKNSSATAAGLRKLGAGTLSHDPGSSHTLSLASLQTSAGTLEVKSGTLTVSSGAATGYSAAMNGFTVVGGSTFRLSGGTVNAKVANYVFTAGHTSGGAGTFILDSGTFDAGGGEILNAYGTTGTSTINGGTFICGPFRVGQGTGTLNLNGGTLRANNLSSGGGTTTVNFNGGTLQAKSSTATFVPTSLTNTLVRAGGAMIDSNTFNVTISHALTEDTGSTGGGLTKKGTGILDLTGTNTYTGATVIQGGTLRISDNVQLGATTAPVTIDGGQFGVSGTAITSLSSLGRTFTYNTGGFYVTDPTNVLDVDIALTGTGALSKSGPGTIKLSGANTFTGGITMGAGDNGWIEVDNAADLGTGAKTANLSSSTGAAIGGFRLLGNVTVSGVALNIGGRNPTPAVSQVLWNVSGNNLWAGNINITNSGGTYYLRSDSGQLELAGILSNAQAANPTADTRAFNLEGAGDFLISGTIADGANANRFTSLIVDATGTTTLTGTNTYTGSTTVNGGKLLINGNSSSATGAVAINGTSTLGGTGSVGGAITVASTATLDPGVTTGTLTAAGNATLAGTLAVQLNGSSADQLAVTGTLDISAATLAISPIGSGATQPVYIIAKYGTLSGTAFANVSGLPGGYALNYAYNDGVSSNNIALVGPVTSTPYSTWAGTTYSLTGGDALPGADPDGDGVKNIVEFALNGNPTSGSNNGLTTTLIQDASAPAGNELTFTIAVRDGATFTSGAGGSQTATVDGVVYTLQGSLDLSAFTSAVSVVGSASDTAPGLPSLAGTSWEYRTFKLDASEGLGGKGFLRVKIETAP